MTHYDIHDLGLQADLAMLTRSPVDRRRILKLGALGIGMLLAGCAAPAAEPTATAVLATAAVPSTGSATEVPAATSVATATNPPATIAAGATPAPAEAATPAECVAEIPAETAGPFPANGARASNQTLNALALAGIVRSDLRTSLGSGNVAQGIPCTIELTLVQAGGDCAPLAGYTIYAWHCDREGRYSMYSSGVTGEDYLRGVQAAANDGRLTFTTIFPGCYAGRWPHVHFEIYPALQQATSAANAVHTSQFAFPQDTCEAVYASDGYGTSARNLAQLSLNTDGIFRDGYALQMAAMTGDPASGYTARLTVGISV
ncbi:MAG TPA: intradiol ring-cleavage dioxygenase [Roseiflexaceae bacterium]|nr:intradiol ring-cleavage dioxygenase [Roseiflexaceae bacterium]HMP40735.1 intradiol ring-cleavage dioxygenase [Roseiflexaceae bacterium]